MSKILLKGTENSAQKGTQITAKMINKEQKYVENAQGDEKIFYALRTRYSFNNFVPFWEKFCYKFREKSFVPQISHLPLKIPVHAPDLHSRFDIKISKVM